MRVRRTEENRKSKQPSAQNPPNPLLDGLCDYQGNLQPIMDEVETGPQTDGDYQIYEEGIAGSCSIEGIADAVQLNRLDLSILSRVTQGTLSLLILTVFSGNKRMITYIGVLRGRCDWPNGGLS